MGDEWIRLLLPCEGPSWTLRSLNWCRSVRRFPLKRPCGAGCLHVLEGEGGGGCYRLQPEQEWQYDNVISSHPDREAHILVDSSEQSGPRRSLRCPYSTCRWAGSLSQGCTGNRNTVKRKQEQIKSIWVMYFSSLAAHIPPQLRSRVWWCWRSAHVPGIVLDAAESQAEGHVATQLLGGRHESLQVVLQTEAPDVDRRVTHTARLCTLSFWSWLTMKYWMISGLLLDLSSTSVNTCNTSAADGTIISILLIMIRELRIPAAGLLVTLDCLSSRHLLQIHGHVSRTQLDRGGYVDEGKGARSHVICKELKTTGSCSVQEINLWFDTSNVMWNILSAEGLRDGNCTHRLRLLQEHLQTSSSPAAWVQPAETSAGPSLDFLHWDTWQEKHQTKIYIIKQNYSFYK